MPWGYICHKGEKNRVAGFLLDFNNGAPGETRTPDQLVRSQLLYPTELRALKIRSRFYSLTINSASLLEALAMNCFPMARAYFFFSVLLIIFSALNRNLTVVMVPPSSTRSGQTLARDAVNMSLQA